MKFMAIIFCIFSFSALAIKGEYASKEHELQSTCKLNFFVNENGKILKGICTGSYLGNRTFSTANHCHKDAMTNLALVKASKMSDGPYYECPGVDHKIPVVDSYSSDESDPDVEQDLAVMKVGEDLKDLKALGTPSSPEQMDKLLEDPTNCYINGYGLDNEDKHGILRAAQVVEVQENSFGFFGGSEYSFRIRKNIGVFGDSGGPLFCYDKGVPILIGIIEGGEKGDHFTKIEKLNQSLEWLNYSIQSSSPVHKLYYKFHRMEQTCSALNDCFNKLGTAAKLTQDMQKVMDELLKESQEIRVEMTSGKSPELKTIMDVWSAMNKEWDRQNCFNVIYPSK